jgi:hypothetical protein
VDGLWACGCVVYVLSKEGLKKKSGSSTAMCRPTPCYCELFALLRFATRLKKAT